MPLATFSTSAPTFSHKLAISLIKDILVAKKALEAYLINSAVSLEVTSLWLLTLANKFKIM